MLMSARPVYGLPTGSKAEMRRWIDLTNEAQHGGTRKVSLERAEEKSSVRTVRTLFVRVFLYSRKNGLRA